MARDLARDWMWSEACEMLARAERLHRDIFKPAGTQARLPAWEPPVDILETEFEVLALVALPGVNPEDAQAVIEEGDLVIAGTRALPPELRTATIHRLELPPGSVYRRGGPPGDHIAKGGEEPWLIWKFKRKKERGAARCRRCPLTRSSLCRCVTPCCFRVWCCRLRSVGRSRLRPPSRRCAISVRSASCCSGTPKSPIPLSSTCTAWARSR